MFRDQIINVDVFRDCSQFGALTCTTLSRDDAILYTGGSDGNIYIWDNVGAQCSNIRGTWQHIKDSSHWILYCIFV